MTVGGRHPPRLMKRRLKARALSRYVVMQQPPRCAGWRAQAPIVLIRAGAASKIFNTEEDEVARWCTEKRVGISPQDAARQTDPVTQRRCPSARGSHRPSLRRRSTGLPFSVHLRCASTSSVLDSCLQIIEPCGWPERGISDRGYQSSRTYLDQPSRQSPAIGNPGMPAATVTTGARPDTSMLIRRSAADEGPVPVGHSQGRLVITIRPRGLRHPAPPTHRAPPGPREVS